MEKEVNPTVDTTKFVNTSDKPYDIYINGKLARHFEAGEDQILPVFVAQVGSKHLADRILFKQGIRDVNRPSPVRDDILAKILPDLQEEVKVKPLTPEEFQEKVNEELKKQGTQIEDLKSAGVKESKSKDKEIEKLKKELKSLKVAKK